MIEKIRQQQQAFATGIEQAGNLDQLKQLRTDFLGKKGCIPAFLEELRRLTSDEKRSVGKLINEFKEQVETRIREKTQALESRADALVGGFDTSLPGRRETRGSLHPITQVMDEIVAVFTSMGFAVAEGPEIESDYYNFEALNIPKNHPARDMQDTFYVEGETVLRTHTSPVQIRVMEKQQPPLRVIAPGRVYRCDSDVSHTPMFHQIEGLMVDENVSFTHLRGTLDVFVREIFGRNTALRFRPSFFPFTCPSAEVDIRCVICSGKGCRVCKQTGWLEILGAGMVDPAVFRHVKYDSERWSGFAFGLGIERIAMLKYGINDLRLFFENDLRFLQQFPA